MRVIDLTHTIREGMPVYPGTEPPVLAAANSYEKDGFKETMLSMFSHTGTHVDPPAHLFAGRTTLDAFPPEQFLGRALVIDCRGCRRDFGQFSAVSHSLGRRRLRAVHKGDRPIRRVSFHRDRAGNEGHGDIFKIRIGNIACVAINWLCLDGKFPTGGA